GQIKIASTRIASILVAPDGTTPPSDQAESETGPPAPRHLVKEPEFERLKALSAWAKENGISSSIDMSFTSETGNTDETSFRVAGKLGREYSNIKLTSDFSYYNKESDGERTDDKFTFGLVRDSAFTDSDWFFFMMGRYDYDDFESWRQRAAFHLGPGYIIGTNFKWKPTRRQTFSFSTFFYAVLDDFDDNRTRTTFDWDYLLSDEMNLSFVLGVLHEYQAVVDPGKDENDTRVHTGFRFRF
ncbi:MAG: DUF481 domain-containing protein, partial [Planctomycetota bacterium]